MKTPTETLTYTATLSGITTMVAVYARVNADAAMHYPGMAYRLTLTTTNTRTAPAHTWAGHDAATVGASIAAECTPDDVLDPAIWGPYLAGHYGYETPAPDDDAWGEYDAYLTSALNLARLLITRHNAAV